MQTHSNYRVVCDHRLGMDVYSARINKKTPHRFLRRAMDEQLEFIASVEYGLKGWQVNLPDFEHVNFDTKVKATNYVKALIALNY